jgi:hypothetical protein
MREEGSKTASGYTRGEWSTKPEAVAECLTCGWECFAKNAQAVGALHARRHKHCVRVGIAVARIYNHEVMP